MRLLLDTHYVLAILRRELAQHYSDLEQIRAGSHDIVTSVVSLWEIAIKTRLGKLDPGLPVEEIGGFLDEAQLPILSIDRDHAVADIEPEPATRDPFDRMLLAQCKVEGLKLVTADRALAGHPLAWRGG